MEIYKSLILNLGPFVAYGSIITAWIVAHQMIWKEDNHERGEKMRRVLWFVGISFVLSLGFFWMFMRNIKVYDGIERRVGYCFESELNTRREDLSVCIYEALTPAWDDYSDDYGYW